MSSLCTYGVLVPKYPARAGFPLRIWGFASTIRTLPNMVCGLLKQAHKSRYLQLRSLALFPVLWINLRTYRTTLLSYPDNNNDLYLNSGIRWTSHTIILYNNSHIRLLHSRTQDRLNTFPCHRRVRHQYWRANPQRHEVARQPESTYCGPYTWNTYPHHCGPYLHIYICPIVTVISFHITQLPDYWTVSSDEYTTTLY